MLDEVDRILDMGFADEVAQIMQNIPVNRVQTLLYSATAKKSLEKLTKKVLCSNFDYFCLNHTLESDISLAGGEGAPGEGAQVDGDNFVPKYSTPVKLTHYYMEVNAENKLDTLFSFIKSHKLAK